MALTLRVGSPCLSVPQTSEKPSPQKVFIKTSPDITDDVPMPKMNGPGFPGQWIGAYAFYIAPGGTTVGVLLTA